MCSTFGILNNFDHSLQTWKTWKCRLTQWFIANDIDTVNDPAGVKRRAVLLSALSEATYKLASDLALPKELQEVPYEDIVILLDGHFITKTAGFSERHNFYAATQLPTETASQWAARLRGLAATCQFSNVEETLRDRFIMGMLPGVEKEKLYMQELSGLTLTKAVEMADNLRSARAAAASASGDIASFPASDKLFKIVGKKSEKLKCLVCGYSNHKTAECRFANYTCKKCNVKGHLKRMCKKVNYVETGEVDEHDDDDGKLFNIRSIKGEPLTETVCVNGLNLKFEIDSGSAVTVMSENTYKNNFKHVPLIDTSKKLFSYTGQMLNCMGCVRMSVQWRDRTGELDVYVVRRGGPPLLGRDFISQFRLELAPIYQCKTSVHTDSLCVQYPTVFSNNLGCFNKYKVTLKLKEDAKPIFFKPRPVAFALKDKVEIEINRLVDLGVLRSVEHSEYASPIVPVLKRDGSVRICADYSVTINKQLVVEQYPLPTVNELFSKLHGGQKFTKLDLSMAYNQFVLDSEAQKLTCINTHRGLFAYTRLVFGLASAPSIFQRAMENVLAGLEGTLCLLDDVCITGRTDEEHLHRLHQVLQRLQSAGLTLQQSKCSFFQDEVCYLGYVINKDGLKKSPEKVKAILHAQVPSNVSQLQSFLGLVNYYRCFVASASTVLSPLYELLKKGTKWHWSDDQSNAFNKIKEVLSSDQVLAHYNSSAKLILTVDASPYGLGAILSQIDNEGCERPISFASRTLNNAEKKYSQIQKEATAIIFGVRRFHQYLYGRSIPFTLRTDHKPLLSIFGANRGIPEVSANRLQRYALFLSGYNYVIEYVKSADNSADYLSRASLPEAGSAEGAPDPADRAAYVCFVVEGALPITLDELRDATDKDSVLRNVIHYVMNGWPRNISDINIKPFYLCRLQLSVENGCLMRGHKVVIPEALRHRVLAEMHSSHLGIVKTKAEARSRFWFPGIDSTLEQMIASCEVCMQLRPSPPRVSISPWPFPPHPFYRLHLDFLGPINNRIYLVIIDAYTKWFEVYEMSTSSSAAVIEKMYEFMSRYGLPHTLVTDNGTYFTSQEFIIFCKLNGITHVTSPAYHPASNGQAESYVKIIKKGIRSSLSGSTTLKESRLKLYKYIFDYRNSVHSTTNTSPAQLVFGRKLRSRFDIMNPSSPAAESSASLANQVKTKQCLQTTTKGGKCKDLHPGQPILYKKFLNNNKFIWRKGVIVKRLGQNVYVISDCLTSTVSKKHSNQIVLRHSNSINSSLPQVMSTQSAGGVTTSEVQGTPRHYARPLSSTLIDLDDIPGNNGGVGDGNVDNQNPILDKELQQGISSPSPSKVTTRRGVRRPAYSDHSADEMDDIQLSGSPPSASKVTMTRGVRRSIQSDIDDDFYEAEA